MKWVFAAVGAAIVFFGIVALCALDLLPIWAGVAIIVTILLAVGGFVLFRVLRKRKAGADLETALAGYATRHAQMGRPDRAAEREELDREFKKAIAALKASKLGRQGGSVLYSLPWYVILGPPGTGKTEALRSSGLKFPHLTDSRSGAIRGLGGTRNCDWWFTNDAILLDTAGRWSTHAEDRDEWLGFLELLRTYRKRSPLNGVIVAVSLSDLANADASGVADLAQQLRARLDEALSVLAVSVPVYLLVTKCDLLPGFVETFGDLTREGRRVPFGTTLPFGLSHAELVPLVQQRLAELEASAEQRALRRMGEERAVRTRELVFSFPDQLHAIVPKVTALVASLFQENYYAETPRLRGLYLTSGTQEGRPFDLVMRSMAQGLGLPAQATLASAPTEKKSYFLEGVFRDVLFPDANLASRSADRVRSDSRVAWGVAAAAALLSLVGIGLYGHAWYANRELASEIESTADRAAGALGTAGIDSPVEAAVLAELGATLHRLDVYATEGVPWSMGFGMYQGERVRLRLGRHYAWLVRQGIVNRLHERELAALAEVVARFEASPGTVPTAAEHRSIAKGLWLHLLLTGPRAAAEPPIGSGLARALAEHLAASWAASLDPGATPAAIVGPTTAFVDRLAKDASLALPRQPELVERARRVLARRDGAEAAVDELVASLEEAGPPVDLRSILGDRAPHLRSEQIVRPAFTREVYEARVAPLFTPTGRDPLADAWVLGADHPIARATPEARRARVLEAFLRRYIAEWQAFVDGLRVEPASDLPEALSVLEEISRGQPSPLESVFETVARNVRLDPPASAPVLTGAAPAQATAAVNRALAALTRINAGSAGGAAGAFTAADVRTPFEPLLRFALGGEAEGNGQPSASALVMYKEQLLYLRNAVRERIEDRNRPDDVREEMELRAGALMTLLEGRPSAVQSALADLLFPPIDGALGDPLAARARSDAWAFCTAIRDTFAARAAGRYPFDASGQAIDLDALAALYHPALGAIPRFRASHASAFLVAPTASAGSFTPEAIAFLEQSRAITDLLFAEGGPSPRIALDVRIVPDPVFTRVTLTVGGARVGAEPVPRRVEWPGANAAAGATLEVERGDGTRERAEIAGPFGFLQLLERAELRSATEGLVTVRFRFGPDRREVLLELRRADGRPFASTSKQGGFPLVAPFRGPGSDAPAEPVRGAPRCVDAP